jgi:hypothetical protein
MRDLINLIDFLSEGITLAASEFKNRPSRYDTFIKKIASQKKFTTVDNQEVMIDPSEAERYQQLWDPDIQNFTDSKAAQFIKLAQGETYNGKDVMPISKLLKTTEFGGASVGLDEPQAQGGKASYALTPKAIGITDRDIPATDFYETIVNNPVLNSTDYGKIVIQLAEYIVSGESVSISPETAKNDKLRAAIQDNAGEYLGVLALLYGRSRFPKRAAFQEWLGASTDELVVKFPSASNFALADSFGMISNPNTNHNINISSKGKDGGAAPAISGLKIPPHIEQDPKLKNGVELVKLCKERGTLDQAFDAMDLIYKANPKAIDKVWHQFLPFSQNQELKQRLIASLKGQKIPFGNEWNSILGSVASETATPGGKIIYAIKREVADAINNKEALPEFRDMVLEILEMNFVQQYTDYQKKNKYEFTFETQWPAKLDGKVSLENKSSAKEPTTGGFSFKLGRTDDSVSYEPGEPRVDDIDSVEDEEEFTKTAKDITTKSVLSKKEKTPEPSVGREKRKKS